MAVRSISLRPVWMLMGLWLITTTALAGQRPNIVLVMADDQGWGQTGYYDHPVLDTPNLDAMAANGLRLDRFYAGAPVCSPTRAAVLTGRTNDRTGVESHGYALRRQEITIAQMLSGAGYVTGHFGKWHLNGMRGPGVPVLHSDDHHPGHFGFDHWLSVTNFFDRDPILSRRGKFEEFQGDSSEIVVDETLKFIDRQKRAQVPSLTVIWFGTPHSPFKAAESDLAGFEKLDPQSQHHYGELVAMDRSIGALRDGLRSLDVATDTLVWFCSDNGGLPKIEPGTVGNLRGNKGTIYEGGLRVPAIIEWPAVITQPRVTEYPAVVMDIVPTVLDITDIQHPAPDRASDGTSLLPLFTQQIQQREQPIGFRYQGKAALIDNCWKVLTQKIDGGNFELYDLANDPAESRDVSTQHPQVFDRMRTALIQWNESVADSFAGKEYPSGKVDPSEPRPRDWTEVPEYEPFFDQWRQRWEYESRLTPTKRKSRG